MSVDYANRWESESLKGWKNVYVFMEEIIYKRLIPFSIHGKRALELGCGDGENTLRIARDFEEVTVVDLSPGFLSTTKERLANAGLDRDSIHYAVADVEKCSELGKLGFQARKDYDAIFVINLLEHLEDPIRLLRQCRELLAGKGVVLISVPNANSLHRQIGVRKGMLDTIISRNERDRVLGHRRIYTLGLLHDHVAEAGLFVFAHSLSGSFLKPLSAPQMNDWGPAVLDSLGVAGEHQPVVAADLCLAAWK